MNNYKPDGIIFDLDGTLWDSTRAISEAWGIILRKHDEIEKKKITGQELFGCMGLPMYDIAEKLFPEMSAQKRNALMRFLRHTTWKSILRTRSAGAEHKLQRVRVISCLSDVTV